MKVQLLFRSTRWLSYSTGAVASLLFWTAPATLAHVGHDSEFQGGDAAQIMESIDVKTNTAEAMGIQTQAVEVSAAGTVSVPSTSIVEAGEQKLVYLQNDTTYTPIAVQTSSTGGDLVEILEGNLSAGDRVVTQGAMLLYSQALRGNPQAEAAPAPTSAPAPAAASAPAPTSAPAAASEATVTTAETTPAAAKSKPPFLWIGMGVGLLTVSALALSNSAKKSRKSLFK